MGNASASKMIVGMIEAHQNLIAHVRFLLADTSTCPQKVQPANKRNYATRV